MREGLVAEEAKEGGEVGGRGGFRVALLEGGLDALEDTGGLRMSVEIGQEKKQERK